MDFQKKAMKIWLKAFDQWAAMSPVPHHKEGAAAVIAAALEQAYKEGVEEMRDAACELFDDPTGDSDRFYQDKIHEVADKLLSKSEEVKP